MEDMWHVRGYKLRLFLWTPTSRVAPSVVDFEFD